MNVGVPQEMMIDLDEVKAANPSVNKGRPRGGWILFFSLASNILTALTASGTTAQRPSLFLWIGRPYFDTDLGIEIWLSSGGPPPVWVRWDGVAV